MAEKKIKKKKLIMSAFTPSVRKQISSLVPFLVWLPSLVSCPFVFVIVISVTDEKSILQNGYSFFPSQFGLDGFEFWHSLRIKSSKPSSSQSL